MLRTNFVFICFAFRVIVECHTLYIDVPLVSVTRKVTSPCSRTFHSVPKWRCQPACLFVLSQSSYNRDRFRMCDAFVNKPLGQFWLDSHMLQQPVNYSYNFYKAIRVFAIVSQPWTIHIQLYKQSSSNIDGLHSCWAQCRHGAYILYNHSQQWIVHLIVFQQGTIVCSNTSSTSATYSSTKTKL